MPDQFSLCPGPMMLASDVKYRALADGYTLAGTGAIAKSNPPKRRDVVNNSVLVTPTAVTLNPALTRSEATTGSAMADHGSSLAHASVNVIGRLCNVHVPVGYWTSPPASNNRSAAMRSALT